MWNHTKKKNIKKKKNLANAYFFHKAIVNILRFILF